MKSHKLIHEFEKAENVREIFEVVKEAVEKTLKESRAGIDIGLMDLGNTQHELLSAFYPVGSNIIVLNKTPLRRIAQTDPELMKPYVFVVLLHEYLHSLGYLDEVTAREITARITGDAVNGVAAEMARDMRKFFPFLLYPGGHPATGTMSLIELDDADYIG